VRILFLTHYFPPEVNAPANRTFEHCRAWAAAGHEVHVVTCVPSHPLGKPFPGYRAGWYRRELMDGVHVHRVWTLLAPNRGVFRRTLNYLSFVPTAVLRSWRLGRFDVIVGTSPQFFCPVAAWATAASRGTPWIFELRDLWPESISAVGAMRKSVPLRLLERLELRMYRSARAVACLTRAFIENLESRGIASEKLRYLPNGVLPAFWENASRAEGRLRLGVAADEVAVSFIGTIGMAHGLNTVIDAARSLAHSHPQIRFFIIGDGAELPVLKSYAASAGASNMTFTGLLPRDRVGAVMAGTDVALVTLKPADTFKTVLPSKMFEAMAARKPVVLGVDGEARRTLESAGGGICVSPGDSKALASAIAALADNADLREQLGGAGASYVAREFNREVWAARYLEMLANVAAAAILPAETPLPERASHAPISRLQ